MKIKSFWGWESNSFARDDKSRNGGGYLQPEGGISLATPYGWLVLEYKDTSCGDFGSRYELTVTAENGDTWTLYWGSMWGGDDTWDRYYSTIESLSFDYALNFEDVIKECRKMVRQAAYGHGQPLTPITPLPIF